MSKPCCASKSQPVKQRTIKQSSQAVGLFLVGLAIDFIPQGLGWSSSPVYWWLIAVSTLGLMVWKRDDFFVGNKKVMRVAALSLLWSSISWLPLFGLRPIWLNLMQTSLLSLQAALSLLIMQDYMPMELSQSIRKRWFQLLQWAQGFFLVWVHHHFWSFQPIGIVMLLGSLTAWIVFSQRGIHQIQQKQARVTSNDSAMRVALTLAMGVSWGFSVLKLLGASFGLMMPQCYFFCDVWKTLAVVSFANTQRQWLVGDLLKVDENQSSWDHYLSQKIFPGLMLTAQLSSCVWFLCTWQGLIATEVFASVLIFACPCVLSLVQPLQINLTRRLMSSGLESGKIDGIQKSYQRQQRVLVSLYYGISVVLSTGLTAPWTGLLLHPWHAAVLMLSAQMILMLNTFRCYHMNKGYKLMGHKVSIEQVSGACCAKNAVSPSPLVSLDKTVSLSKKEETSDTPRRLACCGR